MHEGNGGVLKALARGSSTAPDHAMLIGHAWLWLTVSGVAVKWRRVPSKSNIADRPSRGDVPMWWVDFGVEFVESVLPQYAFQLWNLLS